MKVLDIATIQHVSGKPTLVVTVDLTAQQAEEAYKRVRVLLDKEKSVECTLEPKKGNRSLDANAYMWVLCEKLSKVLKSAKEDVYLTMLERYGVFTHVICKEGMVERVKERWKLTKELGKVTVGGVEGVQLQCYFGSSTYSTGEMSRLINGIVDECKELGVETRPQQEINSMIQEWNIRNKK